MNFKIANMGGVAHKSLYSFINSLLILTKKSLYQISTAWLADTKSHIKPTFITKFTHKPSPATNPHTNSPYHNNPFCHNNPFYHNNPFCNPKSHIYKAFIAFALLYIALYLILIASFAEFGIIDDHTLLSTLLIGKQIPLFIMPQIGRFFPLDAFDLNILSSLFSPNPSVFYIANALFAFILIICIFFMLKIYTDSSALSLAWILLLISTPAFITAFLRLFVPEKLESVFFAIFMLCFVLFTRKERFIYLVCGVIVASIALYYKEVAFIALGGFAFFHILFSVKSFKSKVFDMLLLLSCGIWLVMYYCFVIAIKTSSGSYGDTPYNPILVFAKNALNYTLNEPFLYLGVAGILAFRIYLVWRKKSPIEPLLDSALLACILHHLAYFALNIASPHYPLPAYVFAILPLVVYFKRYFQYFFIKIVFFTCLAIYTINGLPYFLYQFNHYKALPQNFQATLDFLDTYLTQNPKATIYLEGVNRGNGTEVYHSFIKNLEFRGHTSFDMASDLPIDNNLLFSEDKNHRYSLYHSSSPTQKQSGDIVILTPFSQLDYKNIDLDKYELLFHAKYGFNFPHLGIKTLIKYFAIQTNPSLAISSNLYILPIHIYVYKVR